jgi:hypothetical protein
MTRVAESMAVKYSKNQESSVTCITIAGNLCVIPK